VLFRRMNGKRDESGAWTLAGCGVAPGFEFSGFELAPPHWQPVHVTQFTRREAWRTNNGVRAKLILPSLLGHKRFDLLLQLIELALHFVEVALAVCGGRLGRFLRRLACGLIGGLSGLRLERIPKRAETLREPART